MHFKRSLASAAAAALFAAGAAQAAQVSLYGSISTGLVLTHSDSLSTEGDPDASVRRSTSLGMESAWYGDSIWGITGEEDLGGGWSVGFTLENEYGSDTGELATENTLFDSQSYLRIGNGTVNIAAGNLGGLASAGGDFDLVGGFDPLEAAFGVGGMGAFATRDYMSANSAVVEVTPAEGLKLSAMGSFGESDSEAHWSKRTHYYGIGALYEAGGFAAALVGEMLDYDNSARSSASGDLDNAYFVTLGLSYDFGFVKPMFMYQHAEHARTFQGEHLTDDSGSFSAGDFKVDSFLLGATAPLAGGTVMASAQYLKAKNQESGAKGEAYILGAAYTYELSKRTTLYTGATYAAGRKGLDADLDANDAEYGDFGDRAALNGWQFGFGINHTF